MSKSSIRFSLLAISCFALVVALDVMGTSIRPSTRVTEVDKVDQHWRVQEEIYRHLSEGTTFDRTHFSWFDEATTNAAGLDTIYLPFKFSSSDFSVQITATTVSLVAAVPLSDSSVSVALFDYDGNGHAVGYYWRVEGALE